MTGKNKKLNLPVFKGIKINEVQNENWNPKLIRIMLKKENPIFLLNKLYEFLSDENKCELKNIDDNDIILFKKIKEMIK